MFESWKKKGKGLQKSSTEPSLNCSNTGNAEKNSHKFKLRPQAGKKITGVDFPKIESTGIGFIIIIPMPVRERTAYKKGGDRLPIVLLRKYIKAINTINQDYTRQNKKSNSKFPIRKEMLDFAKKNIKIVFVLNIKREGSSDTQQKELQSFKEYWEELFRRFDYPVLFESAVFFSDEENSSKVQFPFGIMRAIPFKEDSLILCQLKDFKKQFKKCFIITGDADLISLYTKVDKSESIFSYFRNKADFIEQNPTRLLGAYEFDYEEVIYQFSKSTKKSRTVPEEPLLDLYKKSLLTILINRLDMCVRDILSDINPSLSYFSETNTAIDIEHILKKDQDFLFDYWTTKGGPDWTWKINSDSDILNKCQKFIIEYPVKTSSRHELFNSGLENVSPLSLILKQAKLQQNSQLRSGQLNMRFQEAKYNLSGSRPFDALISFICDKEEIDNRIRFYLRAISERETQNIKRFISAYDKYKNLSAEVLLIKIENLKKTAEEYVLDIKEEIPNFIEPQVKIIYSRLAEYKGERQNLSKKRNNIKSNDKKGKENAEEGESQETTTPVSFKLPSDEDFLRKVVSNLLRLVCLLETADQIVDAILLIEKPSDRFIEIFKASQYKLDIEKLAKSIAEAKEHLDTILSNGTLASISSLEQEDGQKIEASKGNTIALPGEKMNEDIHASQNAYNQQDKETYKYQGTDIQEIGQYLMQGLEVAYLGAIGNGNKSINAQTILKQYLENLEGNKKAVGIYNFNKDHWIAFMLVLDGMDITLFCKDSLSTDGACELKQKLSELAIELSFTLKEKPEFLFRGDEQKEDVSCGLFALKNMLVFARAQNLENISGFYTPSPLELLELRKEYGLIYAKKIFESTKSNLELVKKRKYTRKHRASEAAKIEEVFHLEGVKCKIRTMPNDPEKYEYLIKVSAQQPEKIIEKLFLVTDSIDLQAVSQGTFTIPPNKIIHSGIKEIIDSNSLAYSFEFKVTYKEIMSKYKQALNVEELTKELYEIPFSENIFKTGYEMRNNSKVSIAQSAFFKSDSGQSPENGLSAQILSRKPLNLRNSM